jgi:stage V sporulation protein B
MHDGWQLMQILSVATVFIIIAQTSTGVLNGIGKTILPVIAMVVGCVVKVIISLIFIPMPQFNISAAAYGTLFAYAVVAVIDFYIVIKHTKININIRETFIAPVVCTAAMVITVVFAFVNMYNLTSKNSTAVMASIVSGALVYGGMLLITKTMSISDIMGFFKR